ncbi:MAG: hypothetical protein HQ523_04340 [Lentisphaerae bacterium]|nr:hypothetical protein [Lentisphaerota bacterium]
MMRRCLMSVLVLFLLCGMAVVVNAVPPAPTAGDLLSEAMRFPVVTVPLVESSPVIDGVVNEAEWGGAALLPNFVSTLARQHEGTAPRYRTRVWLKYTKEALYIACRSDYPVWSSQPAVRSRIHDETTGAESHFDIFINPTNTHSISEMWHLAGNAASVLYDRHLADPNLALHWNPDVEYKSHLIDGGWEGEFRLPFKSLDVEPPTAGALWRANFFFIRGRPSTTLSSWSPWIDWRQVQGGKGYGWLRFGDDMASVRFEQGIEQADRSGPVMHVQGMGDMPVEATLQCYRRTDPFAPKQPAMLMNLARWYSERGVGGAAFLGATLESVTEEVMKRFEPVGPPKTVQLGAGTSGDISLPATPDLGEYLVRYHFVQQGADGPRILSAGALSYRALPEMDIGVTPMLLTADLVEATVDFSNLRDMARAETLVFDVRPADGGDVCLARRQRIVGAEPITFVLKGAELPVGNYEFEAAVLDSEGERVANASVRFARPGPPDWWTHPVGNETDVPAPWTPVQVETKDGKTVVSVWGRAYTFDGLPVPSVVTAMPARYSTGEPERAQVELLAAPMAFRLMADGKAVGLESDPVRVVSTSTTEVVIETLSQTDTLRIKGTTTIEFDGFIKVEVEVAPRADTCAVDSLEFVIPMKTEHATLLGNFRTAPGPGTRTPRYLGALPELPWTHPVSYAQTLGADRVGLQWVCDSTRDWRQNTPDEGCVVRRVGDAIEECFRFIDYPVTLTKPLHIRFGLMALPVKPLPENWGTLRITSASFHLPTADDDAAVRELKKRAAYTRVSVELAHNPGWSGTPWYPYTFSDPVAQQTMKEGLDICHAAGLRLCVHSGWQAISTLIPEWETFGKEMSIAPETETIGKTVFACYNSPYSEYTASLWDHHARTIGIDGVKADTMFPQTPCASLYHDCGWRDERGKLWPSANIFATRNFMKRLYRIFHNGVRKDGITNAAQTGVPIAPICSFTDIVNISEGAPYHHAQTIKEGYPQDLVRVLMVGAPYGLITIHDLKGLPLNANQRTAALLVAGADPRYQFSSYGRTYNKGRSATFDFVTPSMDIWEAWDWIDRGGAAVWMPHWENKEVISVRDVAESDAVLYGSLYVQPGRRIVLVLANYETNPVAAVTTFDLAALGFDAAVTLQAEDAVTRVPLDVDGQTLQVTLQSERYRVIKLWVGEPAQYAEERLGPDLLAGGGFEAWTSTALAIRDTVHVREGQASLCLDTTAPEAKQTGGTTEARLPSVALAAGNYVLQGNLLAPDLPSKDGQRLASVFVSGAGLEYDPPAWTWHDSGRFLIEERTVGWEPFVIPFSVPDADIPVTISLGLHTEGRAWFDDLQLRKVQ